jgi:hypothetical protein
MAAEGVRGMRRPRIRASHRAAGDLRRPPSPGWGRWPNREYGESTASTAIYGASAVAAGATPFSADPPHNGVFAGVCGEPRGNPPTQPGAAMRTDLGHGNVRFTAPPRSVQARSVCGAAPYVSRRALSLAMCLGRQ